MNAQCPECESWIRVPNSAELWDNLVCPRCHTELQLIGDSPPTVGYADYEAAYDDADEDDFDYLYNFANDVFELNGEKED